MGTLGRHDVLLLLLVLSALLIRLFLSPPIAQHGEAREKLVVQEIIRDGAWVLPFRNGELPSKPPLFHWMAALMALLFGFSDSIVRLPSVVGAEIMAVATFLIGLAAGGRRTAWLAVGALLGMYEFWDSGTQARVDMIFAASITVSLAGFFFWHRHGGRIAQATCYLAVACAVLAKGPAGIMLTALVIGAFLSLERRLQLIWKLWSWPLAAFVLAVDLGWYALASEIGGKAFLTLQIGHENIDRFLGVGEFAARSSYLAVLGWLATRTLPWSLSLPWYLIRRLRGQRDDSAGRFLHAWWISILVIFTLAAGKRAVYLLPLYPAVALLAAHAISAFIARRPGSLHAFSSRQWIRSRPVSLSFCVGVALVPYDLSLIVVNHHAWRDASVRTARIVFAEQIRVIVPPGRPIFATPELDDSSVMPIAYRLQKRIERKTIACNEPDEYFLAPFDANPGPRRSTRVLASLKSERIALLSCSGNGEPEDSPEIMPAPARLQRK